ncbi:MAG TPA: MarR family transcriptional regulator [Cyclobacteriaceae bacterium]|nr:MarR family transcriptional regulator [Cyclobacteriaceae bacterium]
MKREETIDYNIKAAWHAIARMYNQQAQKYGGTMSIGFALLNIHSDEGTPATKIGPLMGLETRSLTRLLKSMEEKGLISRVTDKNDKRSIRIMLTREGKRRKEKARDTVLRFNEAIREEIPGQKLHVFFEVVQGINRMIERNEIYQPAFRSVQKQTLST